MLTEGSLHGWLYVSFAGSPVVQDILSTKKKEEIIKKEKTWKIKYSLVLPFSEVVCL